MVLSFLLNDSIVPAPVHPNERGQELTKHDGDAAMIIGCRVSIAMLRRCGSIGRLAAQ
jgi:hypothetical protein